GHRVRAHRADRAQPAARLVASRSTPRRRPHPDAPCRTRDGLPPPPRGLPYLRRIRAPGPWTGAPGEGRIVTGSLVSPATRQRVRGLATPIATALGRLGLSPNALTLIGFLGTCVAAVAAASQWWLAAGVLVLAFGIFDLFDGTLARATGRATKLGAFLDSTFDRAGEGIVYVGIAAGCLAVDFAFGAIAAMTAMTASFMVSYTRAKAESLGFAAGT